MDKTSRLLPALLLAFAIGLGLGFSASLERAHAADPYDGARVAAQTFAAGVTNTNSAQVQGVCTAQLWTRYAPTFQGSPAAGSLGTFELLSNSPSSNRADYATFLVLCTHPDGVEDAVRITLKKVGGAWKVCGGPAAATPAAPF